MAAPGAGGDNLGNLNPFSFLMQTIQGKQSSSDSTSASLVHGKSYSKTKHSASSTETNGSKLTSAESTYSFPASGSTGHEVKGPGSSMGEDTAGSVDMEVHESSSVQQPLQRRSFVKPKMTSHGKLDTVAEEYLTDRKARLERIRKQMIQKNKKIQDDEEFTEASMMQTKKKKAIRNVFTRLEEPELTTGPFSILHRAMTERKKVRVWTRNYKHVRGICTGMVIIYDKHFNMALVDVDEIYRNPLRTISKTKKKRKRKRKEKQTTDMPTRCQEADSDVKCNLEECESSIQRDSDCKKSSESDGDSSEGAIDDLAEKLRRLKQELVGLSDEDKVKGQIEKVKGRPEKERRDFRRRRSPDTDRNSSPRSRRRSPDRTRKSTDRRRSLERKRKSPERHRDSPESRRKSPEPSGSVDLREKLRRKREGRVEEYTSSREVRFSREEHSRRSLRDSSPRSQSERSSRYDSGQSSRHRSRFQDDGLSDHSEKDSRRNLSPRRVATRKRRRSGSHDSVKSHDSARSHDSECSRESSQSRTHRHSKHDSKEKSLHVSSVVVKPQEKLTSNATPPAKKLGSKVDDSQASSILTARRAGPSRLSETRDGSSTQPSSMLERHVGQLFIRGDNVVMVSFA